MLDVSISIKVLDASLFVLLLTWRLSTVEFDFIVSTLFADAADTLFTDADFDIEADEVGTVDALFSGVFDVGDDLFADEEAFLSTRYQS